MENELYGLERGSKAKIYLDSLLATLKKYKIRKHPAIITHMDTGLKKSFLSRLTFENNSWF